MNPNSRVPNALADLCEKLIRSGQLASTPAEQARGLLDEFAVLIDKGASGRFAEAEARRHTEAHCEDWAVRTVGFLEGQLFIALQAAG
jgi:hypothetical protein